MTLSDLLARIRIVLVNPSDPGNIGAAARAMKTMGLRHLYLVAPEAFPHRKASVRASNALDILANTVVVDTLEEVLKDCHLVFGTSTRVRELNWVSLSAREAAEKITAMLQPEIYSQQLDFRQGAAKESNRSVYDIHEDCEPSGNAAENPIAKSIAILFGRERCGLINQELQQCHFQITIPANPDYSSLNLASAVQIVCYELRVAFLKKKAIVIKQRDLAKVEQLEYFYQHLESVLKSVNFLQPVRSQQIMDRLRRLFSRAELDATEVKILRGVLSATQKKLLASNHKINDE